MSATGLSVPLSVLVLGSAALHGLAVRLMPSAELSASRPRPPSAVIVALTAPEPPLPQPTKEVAPEPAAVAARSRPKATGEASKGNVLPASNVVAPTNDDVPIDLTATMLTGGGLALGRGAAGLPQEGQHPVRSQPVASAGPRTVALADLRKAPRAPRLDDALQQHYPAEARRAGLGGQAVLRVQILSTGRVGTVRRVSETHPGFSRACEAALRSAPWDAPLAQDGTAVATEITYTCRFEVQP